MNPRPVGHTIGRPKKFPSLKDFVTQYMQSKLPMNWHHELYYDILENKVVQKPDGRLYQNRSPAHVNKNILMLSPRFHAKSQCFTINYPLWQIYKNPNIRIIIVSANEDIAVGFNRAILNQLENNEKLIDEWGNLVPQFQNKQKWGERAIIVKRDSMEHHPTVTALGVGGKLISRRADLIIIDDLIDIDSARTKMSRQKTLDWFENVLLPILEDNGRLVIVGTAWYKGDIYDSLWQESQFDIRMKLKALMYHDKYYRSDGKHTGVRYIPYSLHEYPQALKIQDVMSEEVIKQYQLYERLKGGVMWEDKWSFDKLMEKKKNMSSSSFMRQYLNEPTSEEEKVFKDKYLKQAVERGANKTLLPKWDNTERHAFGYGHLIVANGVDLAISKKSKADNTAIAVWGLTERRDRVLLYLDYGKWSPDETKQKIIEAYYAFKPAKVRVENVAFQEMMRQQLAEDIPVEGFHTTGSNKFNEETGIAHMAMLFEQGKVIIPAAKTNTDYYERVKQLLYELSAYTQDQHAGDILMASWFAFEALREFDKKLRDNRGYFSTTALVDQLKKTKAPHRVLLLGHNPPVFKFAINSLVYIFRDVDHPEVGGKPFIDADERFMIFVTRYEKTVAYIFEKHTSEIVGKIEGDLTAIMCANLLERAGRFFNEAQIVIDRSGQSESIYLELQKRFYPKLLCMQPDENGLPKLDEGYHIDASNLPLAVDYFKQMVDAMAIEIRDEQLVKEISELIGVEGSTLSLSFGDGQRIKTVASALWLLDNYENGDKLGTKKKKTKNKKVNVPYRVFNY